MNKNFFITIFILIAQSVVVPQVLAQATISAKIEPAQIVVGDQIRYFITATIDTTKGKLRWAAFPDTFNTLELTERGKIDTIQNGEAITYKQRLLITGFDSGSFAIPRFVFFASNKNGAIDSLFTDSFRLAVSTIPVDTAKPFKGIKGVAAVETSWMDNLPLIIGLCLGIGIVVWVTLYLAKNRRLNQPIKAPILEETYYERSLRLLAELDKKELWQQDKPKDYYTELSEIIRQYIEIRFQTNAMELTTDELLRKAKKHREMAVFSKALKPLLEAADLAKFAKANPLPEEHIEALELANKFVQISKPKLEVVPTNIVPSQTRKK